MRHYKKNLKKVSSFIFTILATVSVFFPLGNVSKNNIIVRLFVFMAICLCIILIAVVLTWINNNKNSVVIYSKGKTTIEFLYRDLNTILDECFNKKSTIVVPINTYLPWVGEKKNLRESSIHYQVLSYLNNHGISIDKVSVSKIKRKKLTMIDNDNCTIGDWFIIQLNDYGIESDLKFLFIVNGTLRVDDGRVNNEQPTKKEFLITLQGLCDAIPAQTDMEEPVFMPLLGAGNTKFGNTTDVMHIISDILEFNQSDLLQHISVFIDPRFKNETHISDLI